MTKKPKHDPTTAWTMSNGVASPFSYSNILSAYNYLTGYPHPFTPQQGSLPVSAIAPTYLPISTNTITKTKMADPVLSPAEVEETTELLIGWRTYTIENYKLRGAWRPWESRVFHASCNCKEFASTATNRTLQFEAVEGRREQMREHLASGKGTCGVYSRKKLSVKSDYEIYPSSYPIRVAARCVNYGLGYEYDGGYRSEFCRIEHLYLLSKAPLAESIATGSMVESVMLPVGYAAQTVTPETVAQVLSTTYGVPCDVMSPLEFAYKDEEGML